MYNFHRNLLLVDIEATGLDLTKHEIIQLAAIELDKDTLQETNRFNYYIKPDDWHNRDQEAMDVNQIDWDQLETAQDITTVLRMFTDTFSAELLPANYGGNLDFNMIAAKYEQHGMQYPFDYHVFNIWPVLYTLMAREGQLTNQRKFAGFSLENAATFLQIPVPENRHDAIVDCELEAAVLRAALKAL